MTGVLDLVWQRLVKSLSKPILDIGATLHLGTIVKFPWLEKISSFPQVKISFMIFQSVQFTITFKSTVE